MCNFQISHLHTCKWYKHLLLSWSLEIRDILKNGDALRYRRRKMFQAHRKRSFRGRKGGDFEQVGIIISSYMILILVANKYNKKSAKWINITTTRQKITRLCLVSLQKISGSELHAGSWRFSKSCSWLKQIVIISI